MSISIRPFERTNSRVLKMFRKKFGPHSVDPPPKKRHNFKLFKVSCVGEKKSVADVIRLTVFHICISLIWAFIILFKKFMCLLIFLFMMRACASAKVIDYWKIDLWDFSKFCNKFFLWKWIDYINNICWKWFIFETSFLF